jgi:regulation of enolase protein 1 (concanavalin A-like superfamily)
MNAPRLVRRVRGDFTASVRVVGRLEPGRAKTTIYDPYHGAGLIVWQDSSNYLRFERAVGFIKGRAHPYLNYELRENGRLAVSHGITVPDRALFVRLERRRDTFTGVYSQDGRRWVRLARIEAALGDRVDVGVIAVNASARTLSAGLEGFEVIDASGSTARDYSDDDPPDTRVFPPAGVERGTNDGPGAALETRRR